MLGLRYGVVQLVPHRREWARAFRDEEARLRAALAHVPCELEHVGSTSVPGLPAKPIVDIAVGLARGASVEPVIAAALDLGYVYRGDAGEDGGHVLVLESEPWVRTHHVHVVELGGRQWRSYLLLRELLRSDPSARDAYAAAKAELARRHPEDRRAYTAAKSAIVQRLLRRAAPDPGALRH